MGDYRGYFRQEKNKSLVSNSNQQDVKAFINAGFTYLRISFQNLFFSKKL